MASKSAETRAATPGGHCEMPIITSHQSRREDLRTHQHIEPPKAADDNEEG